MHRFPRRNLLLLAVLIGGMALRLFRLGADSLWYDETVSTYLAGSPLPDLIRHTAGDIHPPLYYGLLRGWLSLVGYSTGQADTTGIGLEFAAGFFSLLLGVLLMVLAYVLAHRVAGRRVALATTALVAFSPYNVWYSQEVRMYTLGAVLGAVALYALLRAMHVGAARPPGAEAAGLREQSLPKQAGRAARWWAAYSLAATAGMYTLYYFAFLLIPLNLWALAVLCRRPIGDRRWPTGDTHTDRLPFPVFRFPFQASRLAPLLMADLAIVLMYAPWIPVAFRQVTDPPVPPWRTAPSLLNALSESWTALSLGQSAPGWLWPVLVLMLGIYALGIIALASAARHCAKTDGSRDAGAGWSAAGGLVAATFGPLALILLVSLITPLYHVRYLFIYSPAFYVVAAAGFVWIGERRRLAAMAVAACWLAASAVTLSAFWFDPVYKADDHRAAVRELRRQWRPGDIVLVNAGYAYPPLYTYWSGPIASRTRLTDPLPVPRRDDALVIVTTGHVDGDPGLGWGDPRSDFFALPKDIAQRQVAALFETYARIWHYRIYDTVNDPNGLLRSALDEHGRMIDERIYPGDAFMRLQGFAPRQGAIWAPDRPSYRYAAGLTMQTEPTAATVASGDVLSSILTWRVDVQPAADIATSFRLVGPDGDTWAQPRDEHPLGPLFPSSQWPTDKAQRQPYAVPIPEGTPPGRYTLALLVYDPVTGAPWPPQADQERFTAVQGGLNLGITEVTRPAQPAALRPSLARFGPLSLVEASSPGTIMSPGESVPVALLWQAVAAPGEPLVVVAQLLGQGDRVAANLEEEPLKGIYPTQEWMPGELVRDRHALGLPPNLPAGEYRLVVGVYRAADRIRLTTPRRWQGTSQYQIVKPLIVR